MMDLMSLSLEDLSRIMRGVYIENTLVTSGGTPTGVLSSNSISAVSRRGVTYKAIHAGTAGSTTANLIGPDYNTPLTKKVSIYLAYVDFQVAANNAGPPVAGDLVDFQLYFGSAQNPELAGGFATNVFRRKFVCGSATQGQSLANMQSPHPYLFTSAFSVMSQTNNTWWANFNIQGIEIEWA